MTVTMPTIGPEADFVYYEDGQRTDEVQPTKLLQVYGNHTPQSDAAILEFWKSEGALPRQDDDFVLQRLGEVLFVATVDLFDQLKAIDGQPVIGIVTVFENRRLSDIANPNYSAKHRNYVFVGWTPRDEQNRIAYFNDVRMF